MSKESRKEACLPKDNLLVANPLSNTKLGMEGTPVTYH